MLSGLYSAASTMAAAEQQHEAIAQNLAHAQMPGYRRVSLQETQTQANFADELRDASQSIGGGIMTDFSPGTLVRTANPLDVAINGKGFFEVADENGNKFYTRNGTFQLSEDGTLRTVDGLSLASKTGGSGKEGGLKIPKNAVFQQIEISSTGAVMVDGTTVGEIKVVEFENSQLLQRAGITLFAAPEDVQPAPSSSTVMQNMREQANVSPIQELVALIETQRRYEAAQKSMSLLSEAIQRHIDQK